MGPKKQKKDKKKKKKEKEKPPKPLKSEYLKKIAERNAVLAAARKKIQKIEDVYWDTEKRYEQTQEDMADIIKYLQHEIEENELEIAEYDEKISAYKEEISTNDKYYQSILSRMEAEYEEKEKALQDQIQQYDAKLSAFKEVKHQREEYLRKKEHMYQKMQELKARHQQEIYEAEKQAIIKQANTQKQMEANLTKLALDFREATDVAIGDTTNKLIRDNIILGNTLTCTQEIFERARDSYRKINELENRYRYNAELLDEENKMLLEKYATQVNEIENLLKSHEELLDKIKFSEKLIKDNRRLQRQIAENECILKEKIVELNDLMKLLNENKDIFNSIKNAFNYLRKNVVKMEMSLYEAATKVKYGIDIETITQLPEESTEDFVRHEEKDEKDQEEDLKEYKYKEREAAIIEILEKLGNGLLFDMEVDIPGLVSETYLGPTHYSTMSDWVS